MDEVTNPYNPGAGTRPYELTGRNSQVHGMEVTLQRLLSGRSGRSQLLTGLRGVGKTVLLEEFSRTASRLGYIHEHVEISEDGKLPLRLAAAMRRVLIKLDRKKRVGEAVVRALGSLKAFTLTLPDGVSLNIDVPVVHGLTDSGDLAGDLAGLFEELSRLAKAHDTGVLVTIDEMHYIPISTLEPLIMGLHRTSQLGLPITIAGAGLPSLPAVAGEAKSYAERLFTFPTIDSLDNDEVADALTAPAAAEGVVWTEDAVARLYELSHGYPYFIQEFGKQAWDLADEDSRMITRDDVEQGVPLAIDELDSGFFQVRTGKTTDQERAYLRAMAELGPGIVLSADVAKLMHKKTTQLGPARDSLLKKALCYSPRHNELAFTAPMFDEFMKRWMPEVPQ
jgi:hypothetical protein